MRGGRGLLILGNLVVEAQVRLSRALIPSVEGARPQGESRLSHGVSAAILASIGAISPPWPYLSAPR
eukprot:COSAG01_NODE_9693_length_2366_cov_1.606167_2_plen_67_part_00